MQPISITALGDLSTRYRLHGVCNVCHDMRPLNMLLLLRRLGRAFPIRELGRHLRCQDCGGRDCGIRIVWLGKG